MNNFLQMGVLVYFIHGVAATNTVSVKYILNDTYSLITSDNTNAFNQQTPDSYVNCLLDIQGTQCIYDPGNENILDCPLNTIILNNDIHYKCENNFNWTSIEEVVSESIIHLPFFNDENQWVCTEGQRLNEDYPRCYPYQPSVYILKDTYTLAVWSDDQLFESVNNAQVHCGGRTSPYSTYHCALTGDVDIRCVANTYIKHQTTYYKCSIEDGNSHGQWEMIDEFPYEYSKRYIPDRFVGSISPTQEHTYWWICPEQSPKSNLTLRFIPGNEIENELLCEVQCVTTLYNIKDVVTVEKHTEDRTEFNRDFVTSFSFTIDSEYQGSLHCSFAETLASCDIDNEFTTCSNYAVIQKNNTSYMCYNSRFYVLDENYTLCASEQQTATIEFIPLELSSPPILIGDPTHNSVQGVNLLCPECQFMSHTKTNLSIPLDTMDVMLYRLEFQTTPTELVWTVHTLIKDDVEHLLHPPVQSGKLEKQPHYHVHWAFNFTTLSKRQFEVIYIRLQGWQLNITNALQEGLVVIPDETDRVNGLLDVYLRSEVVPLVLEIGTTNCSLHGCPSIQHDCLDDETLQVPNLYLPWNLYPLEWSNEQTFSYTLGAEQNDTLTSEIVEVTLIKTLIEDETEDLLLWGQCNELVLKHETRKKHKGVCASFETYALRLDYLVNNCGLLQNLTEDSRIISTPPNYPLKAVRKALYDQETEKHMTIHTRKNEQTIIRFLFDYHPKVVPSFHHATIEKMFNSSMTTLKIITVIEVSYDNSTALFTSSFVTPSFSFNETIMFDISTLVTDQPTVTMVIESIGI